MQFLSIYLHIPFCRARCSYCAFNIYTDRFALVTPYIEALCREIRLLGHGEAVHSLYLGGGTPSLLTVDQLERILMMLRQHFEVLPQAEVTLEANPRGVDEAYFRALHDLGVNRLSLGMQSALADELALYARDHTLEDMANAFYAARRAGFRNISLDLIYGAPKQRLEDWEATLDAALAFAPEHFSLYALQLESGTELTRRVKHAELPAPDDDLMADMYDLALEKLAGYEHYEISSLGKAGCASLHNLQYWRNLSYLGLGAGAHGYVGGCRTVNVMRPERYIERLGTQTAPLDYPRTAATQSLERISRQDEMFETVMLGLRLLKEGLSRTAFEQRFGVSLVDAYGEVIAQLKQQGLIIETEDKLLLSRSAYFISNRVFQAFMTEVA